MTRNAALWLGLTAAALAAGCLRSQVQMVERRECPKEWNWDSIGEVRTLGPELSAPGQIQNVPEFHDCQRFLVTDTVTDELRYDSLFGIFFTERPARLDTLALLDTLRPGEQRDSVARRAGFRVTDALPSAEIWADGNDYDSLGIKAGFNCLYLYRDRPNRRWAAKMTSSGYVEQDCSQPVDAASLPGTQLEVRPGGLGLGEVPKVARWDWDDRPRRQQQLIGIYCGASWCEVGASGSQGEPAFLAGVPGEAGLPPGLRRVYGIKGWYDQQYLATLPSSGNKPIPTALWGTIIPHPELGRINTIVTFGDTWVSAAEVALSARPGNPNVTNPYAQKLNLAVTPNLRRLNQVHLCHGQKCPGLTQPDSCAAEKFDNWWAQITNADNGNRMYRCVARCDMSSLGIPIPGTVRWRWLADDEKSWTRCAQGCCDMY